MSLQSAHLQPGHADPHSASSSPDGPADPATPPINEPLCIDLDGTLVKSDTLLDSVIVLSRQSPRSLLRLPIWVLQGKAAFKRNVSSVVALDVVHLPFNQPL